MANPSNGPKSLSEAIAKLESSGVGKSAEIKDFLDKELQDVKKKLEELKPYLEEVKEKASTEAKRMKGEVEHQVKENPWYALGLVALVGLVFGLLIGWGRRK